jgi:hypothetical protein
LILNTQLQTSGTFAEGKSLAVHNLYNNYAAMLLGYIFEVVKNRSEAEQYLIAVFTDAQSQIDEFYKPGVNAFCRLQLMARKKLADFFLSIGECNIGGSQHQQPFTGKNKFIQQMDTQQQFVFCGLHWHGKTIGKVAAELNKTENDIRKILKECFTIIRNSK